MGQNRQEWSFDELIQRVEDVLGEVYLPEEEAPGVYYMGIAGRGEYYIVSGSSDVISPAAKQYGVEDPDLPGLRLFPFEEKGSGSKIVEYEIERYRAAQDPSGDNAILREVAIYAMEQYPEYFGFFPAPIHTPWGMTLRYINLCNGVIWFETDQCKKGLAICCPSWMSDISAHAAVLGEQSEYDQQHGIDRTFGYLFFSERDACVPLYELLKDHRDWEQDGRIDCRALMNAIYQNHPDYVITNNARKQLRLNDPLGDFLRSLGIVAPSANPANHIISIFPDSGVDYLKW